MTTFRVVLAGTTLPGNEAGEVRDRLAALINREPDVAARLLAGKPSTVRRGLDQPTGLRYVEALEKIGVACGLEPESLDVDLDVPQRTAVSEDGTQKVFGQQAERLAGKVEGGISDVIKAFVSEQQDPAAVAEIYAKVSEILTREERVTYIAIQSKPVVNVRPDAVVLTNRRFIVYQPRMLGRVDFTDFIWRDLLDVRLKEGILGATITLKTVANRILALDYLPKSQARRIYALAQEMEERVREERRLREMEERRASAGGVVIQGGSAPGFGAAAPAAAEDPVQKLTQLKQMLDSGLITPGEYEAKRQAILSRM